MHERWVSYQAKGYAFRREPYEAEFSTVPSTFQSPMSQHQNGQQTPFATNSRARQEAGLVQSWKFTFPSTLELPIPVLTRSKDEPSASPTGASTKSDQLYSDAYQSSSQSYKNQRFDGKASSVQSHLTQVRELSDEATSDLPNLKLSNQLMFCKFQSQFEIETELQRTQELGCVCF